MVKNLDKKILYLVISFLAILTLFIHQDNRKEKLEGEKKLLEEKAGELEDRLLQEAYWNFLKEKKIYQPPVEGIISSPVGVRTNPMGGEDERLHRGEDIAAPLGTPVRAALGGIVADHYPPPNGYFRGHPIYGGMIVIDHGGGLLTLYGHLSSTSVHIGERVKKGEIIGKVGSTGISTGPHLHWEIVISPSTYFEGEGKLR
jgi:murein DD-endopeptidase MepM/ murein hydrolase activator NlpD